MNGRNPTPCTTPRTLMDRALGMSFILSRGRTYDASSSLPADRDHFAIFDQDRAGALSVAKGQHATERFPVRFHVVLDKIASAPLERLAHFTRIGAAGRAVQFKIGHGTAPPAFRESHGKS